MPPAAIPEQIANEIQRSSQNALWEGQIVVYEKLKNAEIELPKNCPVPLYWFIERSAKNGWLDASRVKGLKCQATREDIIFSALAKKLINSKAALPFASEGEYYGYFRAACTSKTSDFWREQYMPEDSKRRAKNTARGAEDEAADLETDTSTSRRRTVRLPKERIAPGWIRRNQKWSQSIFRDQNPPDENVEAAREYINQRGRLFESLYQLLTATDPGAGKNGKAKFSAKKKAELLKEDFPDLSVSDRDIPKLERLMIAELKAYLTGNRSDGMDPAEEVPEILRRAEALGHLKPVGDIR